MPSNPLEMDWNWPVIVVTELKQPLDVETPLGRGMAIFIETGPSDQYWTVIMSDSRAIVTFPQNKIRAGRSYTHGRGLNDEEMREIINPDRGGLDQAGIIDPVTGDFL